MIKAENHWFRWKSLQYARTSCFNCSYWNSTSMFGA